MKNSTVTKQQGVPLGIDAMGGQASGPAEFVEKRSKPRIWCDYPAVIRGQDAQRKKFEAPATLVNLSRTGLYLRVNRSLFQGDQVIVTISLTNPKLETDPPRLTASGIVVRTEPQLDEEIGLAIQIQHYRFL